MTAHLQTLLVALAFVLISAPTSDADSQVAKGQCPTQSRGWYLLGQKCYKPSPNVKNYSGAMSKCKDFHSQLVEIESSESPNYDEKKMSVESLSGILSASNKSSESYRLYYVDISQELQNQFSKLRKYGFYNESLNVDDDGIMSVSNLWLPRDDPAIANHTANLTQLKDDIGFVMVYSQALRRWGLSPVPAAKKFNYICEHDASQESQPAPASILQSQDKRQVMPNTKPGDNKKNVDVEMPLTSNSANNYYSLSGANGHQHSPQVGQNHDQINRAQPTTTTTTAQPESLLFRELPQDSYIVLGSTAELRCSALDNESSLTWTLNGKNLTASNRIKPLPNGTLRIEHVRNSDSGNYTCTIYSSGVSEAKTARLELIERPLQPEWITAELLDRLSTSVSIKWSPGFNGNSPIIKYLAEMRTVNSDNFDSEITLPSQTNSWEVAKANISADQTSVVITDLKPAKKYIFRVRAINRVGTGDPSQPTRPPIEIPVQPPSMAPENLAGTPKSSMSILLQWQPPPAEAQNGLIKGYKIRHKLAGYATDTEWYTSDVPDAAHSSYVLDDLIVWQNYEIQIAAENDKGAGPFSSSIYVRTKEGKPDRAPRSVRSQADGPTAIKVNWNSPPPQHINGQNQGYRVQVWQDLQQTKLAKEIVVGHNSVSPFQGTTIDGLSPYTSYYITVKCYTSAGDGPANDELVKVRTQEDYPEAVPILEFADVLDKSLRLLWRPPHRINGELDHYTVEYSETLHSDKKILKDFPADYTEARITDLIPQTSYTFKIFPHTHIGPGPGKTNGTTTSVPPVLPEPPSNLIVTNVGSNSVTIQFNPGFDGNASIEKWVAEALVLNGGDVPTRWQQIFTSTNHSQGSSVVIRNLHPFTRYKIRLIPFNVVGSSRYPSEPTKDFQTSQVEPEEAPRDLSIEDIKSNSVIAHWSPLSNNLWLGNPKGYNLTWSESSNSTVMHYFINDTRAESCLIRGLEEFTEYSFKIHAVNEAGQSPPGDIVVATTLEDVPTSGPTNLTAHAVSSSIVSVDWGSIPKRHKNGNILGYKIQYQANRPDAPLQHKTVEDGTVKHITLNDLKAFISYKLAVAGYTSAGDGVFSGVVEVQTLEDTPGKPQNLTFPSVSQTSALVLWDPPGDPNGDIIGYRVTWYQAMTDGNKEVASHELHHNERTFKATNLKPDTHYVFTVTAKTKEGWGQQNSQILYTYDSQLRANLPFFRESWFVISCACVSVVITIITIALLFIETKSYEYKQDAIKSTSQDRLGDAGFSIDDEANNHYNNGFGLLTQNAHHRRSNGALSQNTANFTLPKSPPRPHPGSVVYSDEGDDDVFEDVVAKNPVRSVAGTSRYDSSGDSLTEKPSEISSSTGPESESADDEYVDMASKHYANKFETADDEYINMANKHFVNHYANVNGTLRGQKAWRKQNKHYSSHKTKPKLPQRPAPMVPQVPGEPSSSSSETNGQPTPGTSGISSLRTGSSLYDESTNHKNPLQPNFRNMTQVAGSSNSISSHQQNGKNTDTIDRVGGSTTISNTHDLNDTQQNDLLNSHMVNLNGGRIIVDNMAGSRAPLPGFTSFV